MGDCVGPCRVQDSSCIRHTFTHTLRCPTQHTWTPTGDADEITTFLRRLLRRCKGEAAPKKSCDRNEVGNALPHAWLTTRPMQH